jgi:hypothetical protein
LIFARLTASCHQLGWLAVVRPDGSFTVDVLPASLVAALGMSLAFIPSLGTAISSARPEEGGLASGIVNTSYQVGSALGLAAMTAVASSAGADRPGDLAALADAGCRLGFGDDSQKNLTHRRVTLGPAALVSVWIPESETRIPPASLGLPATTATELARASPGASVRGLRLRANPCRSHTSSGRPSRRPSATTTATANTMTPTTIHAAAGSRCPNVRYMPWMTCTAQISAVSSDELAACLSQPDKTGQRLMLPGEVGADRKRRKGRLRTSPETAGHNTEPGNRRRARAQSQVPPKGNSPARSAYL